MTSNSKTCQIEGIGNMMREGYLLALEEAGMNDPIPLLREMIGNRKEIDFLPCPCKAKHSMIIRASEFCNRNKKKFRLCDLHFNYLYRDYQETSSSSNARPFCKFRRNRL